MAVMHMKMQFAVRVLRTATPASIPFVMSKRASALRYALKSLFYTNFDLLGMLKIELYWCFYPRRISEIETHQKLWIKLIYLNRGLV